MVAPFLPDAEKVAAIREALPASGAGIYLDTGSAGPLPVEAVRAMREAEDWEIRVGRATPDGWEAFLDRMEEARAVVAALLSTDPDSVALTHSTTEGMTIATWAHDWGPGDQAVTSGEEHRGLLAPLVALRERLGVELSIVEVGGGRDETQILEAFDRAITERTRLVSVSHVTWATGGVLPIEQIAALAHDRGAWFAVDGAQAAGAIRTDVPATGADFYAVSAYKWLLGPEGTGALWVGPRAQADARQTLAGPLSFEYLTMDGRGAPAPAARRFESSGLHRSSLVGLARAVGWLEMYVGLEWAYERAARLCGQTAERLAALPGVTVLTPPDRMATLLAFRISGWSCEQVREELSRRVFAVVRAIPELDAVRASVAFFNTDEELKRFVDAVAELARHTPDTLPRRPTLVVVSRA
ncbi:MAG: aminotransferase class V-fold PLP-dependent enzyme [Chloroflexota bacterium]|nr:aminotransferase class V-fold PLP-dependent enzyme [Chloroflexota bacterium]